MNEPLHFIPFCVIQKATLSFAILVRKVVEKEFDQLGQILPLNRRVKHEAPIQSYPTSRPQTQKGRKNTRKSIKFHDRHTQ